MITRLKTQKGNIEVRRDFSKEGMTQVRTHSCKSIGVLMEFFRKLVISSTLKMIIHRISTFDISSLDHTIKACIQLISLRCM